MKRFEPVFHSSSLNLIKQAISHALRWNTVTIYIIHKLWYLWTHETTKFPNENAVYIDENQWAFAHDWPVCGNAYDHAKLQDSGTTD